MNFIEAMVEKDLAEGKNKGRVQTLSRPGRGTMIELKIRALPWDGHGGGTLSGHQPGAV